MGIFKNLFGSNKLKIIDPEFGEIESFFKKGNNIGWKIKKSFLDAAIEILIIGNEGGISEKQRQIVLDALNNENEIKTEAEKALKEQFENAEMDFIAIEKHFEPKSISIQERGFEMSFQEKEGQNCFFNVHFENNKQVGVSIDG